MNFIKLIKNPKILKCVNSIDLKGNAGGVKMLKRCVSGVPGSGAGKGGGAGGAIKEGGGGLGMWGTAKEEGYFYDKQREQLRNMKRRLEEEKKNEQRSDKKPK